MPKELSIIFCKDGKYRFIGSIFEKELNDLSNIGFDFYYDARSMMGDFGYSLFGENEEIKQARKSAKLKDNEQFLFDITEV